MSLKKVFQAREHRERSQPAARRKLGLLEKKKDYVLRARDFHSKEKRLKALRQKANMKNPDEFYFGMINSRTTKGIHSVSSKPELPADVLKLMKTQDMHYVGMVKRMNERRMEKLKEMLPASLADSEAPKDHIVFAEDSEEKEQIILEHADNSEEKAATKDADPQPITPSAALREYQVRKERISALSLAERKLQTQRHIMQPGRRKVVGQDEYEQPVFKWKAQRKK